MLRERDCIALVARRRWPAVLFIAALLLTAVHAVALLAFKAYFKDLIPRWQASQYWLGYENGFVRRGLPGEVLHLLVGGMPTYLQMTAYALVLSGSAAVALVLLAIRLSRLAEAPFSGSAVVVLVLVSPFTLSLLAWDTGRYDALGIVALVAIAVLLGPGSTLRPWMAVLATSGAAAVAVAAEEFLLAFLAPTVVLGMSRAFRRDEAWAATFRRPWIPALAALGPACVVALLSVVVKPTASAVWATFAAARSAGVDIEGRPGTSAVTALLQSPADAAHLVMRLSGSTRVFLVLGLALLYLVSAGLIRHLVGPWAGWTVVAVHGVPALCLGFVGVDYRRWWALAFVAALACFVMLAQPGEAKKGDVRADVWTPRFAWAFAAVLMLSVAAQAVPVFPTWERALGSKPPPALMVIDAVSRHLTEPGD